MKVYILTEAELDALAADMELSFRERASRAKQDWNLLGAPDQAPTFYDCFKTANYVFHRWKGKVS